MNIAQLKLKSRFVSLNFPFARDRPEITIYERFVATFNSISQSISQKSNFHPNDQRIERMDPRLRSRESRSREPLPKFLERGASDRTEKTDQLDASLADLQRNHSLCPSLDVPGFTCRFDGGRSRGRREGRDRTRCRRMSDSISSGIGTARFYVRWQPLKEGRIEVRMFMQAREPILKRS